MTTPARRRTSAWWASLPARDRRALRVLACVLAVALAWQWLVRPGLQEVATLRDRIAVERALLDRERTALAAARAEGPPVSSDSLAARIRPALFAGRDDAITSAALAAWLATQADAHDVWVRSTATLPTDHGPAGLRTLGIELRGEADVTGLVRFLASLTGGSHIVRVTSFDVVRRPDTDQTSGLEPLAITVRASGFAEAAP